MSEQALKTDKYRVSDNSNNDEIDLGKLLGTLLDSKWVIILTTVLFTFLGVFYAITATPVYKANAVIQVEDSAPGIPGLDDMTEMFSSESSSDTEIQIIKSRYVIGQTVDELQLTNVVKPNFFPLIGEFVARRHKGLDVAEPFWGSSYAWGGEELLISKFSVSDDLLSQELTLVAESDNQYSLWFEGEELLKGRVGQTSDNNLYEITLKISDLKANEGTEFTLTKLPRLQAIMDLQEDLSVNEQGKQTGIISLNLLGEDKKLIAETLDSISKTYFLQNVQRLAAEAENSLSFLKEQIPQVKSDLIASEDALNKYRLERDSVDLTLETKTLLENLVDIEAKINEMAIAEADISRRFTEEHPNYISFKRQQTDLIKERDRITQKTGNLPETQQKLLRLMRDFEVNQEIYLALQNKSQELAIVKASTVGNVRILDSADVFPKAEKPKKPLIVIVATLFGGMLSVAYVLIKSAFNRGVTNPQEFEDIGLNVYATIPVSETQQEFNLKQKSKLKLQQKVSRKKQPKEFLLAHENPTDSALEALRSLRTSLHFAMLEAKNNVVMITGASPDVGKSFISSNLAIVLAQAGQKVLLIDADMRKGYIQKAFKAKAENGLSDVLLGTKTANDVIKSTETNNLDLITRGAVPTNPSEILMGKYLNELIQQVSKDYDIVLIDTPPILAVTDAAIIGKYAGTSFLLARYKQSHLKEIAYAANRFELNGINIRGLIFNAVEKSHSVNYGYLNYEYTTP
ncbi:polysaccharide biosynthesis tyrosine autokinase [Thalassotalea aquiviva]|uniref:polysaccharide biosynthesis tyrosine autokinase n=1 Tax=Thalassotalea aquiviva TaxID=3242415 RepID=UPI00352B1387